MIGSSIVNRLDKISFTLVPKLVECFEIVGTLILIIDNNENKHIYSIDEFDTEQMADDEIFKSRLTSSRYLIYNRGFENEFIMAEARIS